MYRVKFGEKRVLFLFKWDICWFYAQRQNQNEATEEDGEYKFSQLCQGGGGIDYDDNLEMENVLFFVNLIRKPEWRSRREGLAVTCR